MTLKIAYLLEGSALSGGVRVVLGQADALIRRGHEITVVSKDPRPTWRNTRANWEVVPDFRKPAYDDFDFVIATFWTTVAPAFERAGRRTIHLCQGLEFTFSAYAEMSREIQAAYSLPIPKIVISSHLVGPVSRFGDDVTPIPQIIDEDFFVSADRKRHDPPRVLLVGAMQIDFKGIDLGYEAVRIARNAGAAFDLVRVSPWEPAEGEPIHEASHFFVSLETTKMAALVASCQAFLGPSRHQEGFGLPAAEAMAAGVPCVLTKIPSFQHFQPERDDFALWAAEEDPSELGLQLNYLLRHTEVQSRLSAAGREVVRQYRADNVGSVLESFFTSRWNRLDSTQP